MDYPRAFDPLPFQFSRASTAHVEDHHGQPCLVPADTPRLLHSRWDGTRCIEGTGEGILIEPEVTNLLINNTNIKRTGWVTSEVSTHYIEEESDYPQTPDTPTMNGSFVNYGVSSPYTGTASFVQQLTLPAATRTVSIYLRKNTTERNSEITTDGSTWSPITLEPFWKRYVFTVSHANPAIGLRWTALSASYEHGRIDMYLPQIEDGPAAHQAVRSDATPGVKAPDVCYVDFNEVGLTGNIVDNYTLHTNIMPLHNGADYAEGAVIQAVVSDRAGTTDALVIHNAGGFVAATVAGVTLTSTVAITADQELSISFRSDGTGKKLWVDSDTQTSGSTATPASPFVSVNLGRPSQVTHEGMFAHACKSVSFVPKALADDIVAGWH